MRSAIMIAATPSGGPVSYTHLDVYKRQTYIRAVAQGGGIPVLIPAILSEEDRNELYPHLQGILFSGGGDMDIKYFNGVDHPQIHDVDDDRDVTELSLIKRTIDDGKPFLAICRGVQVMNVALGGTLYTHIPVSYTHLDVYKRQVHGAAAIA